MKFVNLLALMVLIFSFQTSHAQEVSDFKKERKNLIEVTSMDSEQISKLDAIYEKRVADLKLIENMKNTDEQAYYSKRRAIYQGSEVSIRLLMKQEQLDSFRAYAQNVRIERADRMKKLRKKNASRAEIIDAQYGIQ